MAEAFKKTYSRMNKGRLKSRQIDIKIGPSINQKVNNKSKVVPSDVEKRKTVKSKAPKKKRVQIQRKKISPKHDELIYSSLLMDTLFGDGLPEKMKKNDTLSMGNNVNMRVDSTKANAAILLQSPTGNKDEQISVEKKVNNWLKKSTDQESSQMMDLNLNNDSSVEIMLKEHHVSDTDNFSEHDKGKDISHEDMFQKLNNLTNSRLHMSHLQKDGKYNEEDKMAFLAKLSFMEERQLFFDNSMITKGTAEIAESDDVHLTDIGIEIEEETENDYTSTATTGDKMSRVDSTGIAKTTTCKSTNRLSGTTASSLLAQSLKQIMVNKSSALEHLGTQDYTSSYETITCSQTNVNSSHTVNSTLPSSKQHIASTATDGAMYVVPKHQHVTMSKSLRNLDIAKEISQKLNSSSNTKMLSSLRNLQEEPTITKRDQKVMRYLTSTMKKSTSGLFEFPSEYSSITATAESVGKIRQSEKTPERTLEFKMPGSPSKPPQVKVHRQGSLQPKNSTRLFTTGFVEIVDVISQISTIRQSPDSTITRPLEKKQTFYKEPEELLFKPDKQRYQCLKTSTPNKVETSEQHVHFDIDLSSVNTDSEENGELHFHHSTREVNSEEIINLSDVAAVEKNHIPVTMNTDGANLNQGTAIHKPELNNKGMKKLINHRKRTYKGKVEKDSNKLYKNMEKLHKRSFINRQHQDTSIHNVELNAKNKEKLKSKKKRNHTGTQLQQSNHNKQNTRELNNRRNGNKTRRNVKTLNGNNVVRDNLVADDSHKQLATRKCLPSFNNNDHSQNRTYCRKAKANTENECVDMSDKSKKVEPIVSLNKPTKHGTTLSSIFYFKNRTSTANTMFTENKKVNMLGKDNNNIIIVKRHSLTESEYGDKDVLENQIKLYINAPKNISVCHLMNESFTCPRGHGYMYKFKDKVWNGIPKGLKIDDLMFSPQTEDR